MTCEHLPPRLTINIGIVGHRRISPPCEPALRREIAAMLRLIRTQVEQMVEQGATRELIASLYTPQPPRLVLLSALAAGADSIVAEEALAQGYELHVPLPMAREEYARDFDTPETLATYQRLLARASRLFEIRDANPERGHSYADASRIVLNHSDVLLALWDRKDTEFVAGTAATLGVASRRHIPVIHVHADASVPPSILIDSLRFTNWQEKLQEHLESLLLPVEAQSSLKSDIRFTLACARQQTIPPMGWGICGIPGLVIRAEKWFSRLLRWLPPHPAPSGVVPPIDKRDTFSHPAPEGAAQAHSPACLEDWRRAFHWFDELSNAYSARYRGGLVVRYLSPVLATVCLTCAFYWQNMTDSDGRWWFGLQALFLLIPLCLQMVDRRRMWHRKFFSYRVVGEQLRQTIYLGPLGFAMLRTAECVYRNSPQRWTAWYYRAIIRDVGLPHVSIGHEYLKHWLLWTRDHFVVEQLNYHENRWRREGNMCRKLVTAGIVTFLIGIALAILRGLLSGSQYPVLEDCVSAAVLIVPALAVFFAGFCAYACYAKDQQVSFSCGETLEKLRREMDAYLKAEGFPVELEARDAPYIRSEALHFTRAYNIVERIHECCKGELLGWEDLISTRNIQGS